MIQRKGHERQLSSSSACARACVRVSLRMCLSLSLRVCLSQRVCVCVPARVSLRVCVCTDLLPVALDCRSRGGRPRLLGPDLRAADGQRSAAGCVLLVHGAQGGLLLPAVLPPWTGGAAVQALLQRRLSAAAGGRQRPGLALVLTVRRRGAGVELPESGGRVLWGTAAGALSDHKAADPVVGGGALVVLRVSGLVVGVEDAEAGRAGVQAPDVCGVQAVAPGPRALVPLVAPPRTGPGALLKAAEHHGERRAGRRLGEPLHQGGGPCFSSLIARLVANQHPAFKGKVVLGTNQPASE